MPDTRIDVPTGRGIPIVLSAASGTGKTTLGQRLIKRFPQIKLSVSYTTRAPRSGEVNGIDYYFVSTSQFEDMVHTNAFIEWAQVHGNMYGTAYSEVSRRLQSGEDVLLDIDVQGGKSIRDRLPDSLLVFLLPPSLNELRRRLSSRGTESPEQVQLRLLNARREIEAASIYDYLIVNDDLDKASDALAAVVHVERIRRMDKAAVLKAILTADNTSGSR
ncbi:MAG: guanylate kinase [Deltaproteobacteria bacterium]|nr:guanylate kinase [Deltaproteobacteria bacterium]